MYISINGGKVHFQRGLFLGLVMLNSAGFTQDGKVLNLDDLVIEALQNNPALRAARYETEATRTQIKQAKAWEAPQIGIEFFQTPVQSFPNPVKDGMETDYFVQQMIPFPGKISSMTRSARNSAGMSEENYKALERQVIRELKSAYYELYLVQRKIMINAENQDLMRQFVDIAMKQYEVGMGKQPDILRAQTELSNLVTEGINLQQEKQVVEAMINVLRNRPANESLRFVPDIAAAVPTWTFDQLMPVAVASRPELQAMNYNIAMNRAEVSLAKREYFPDLMLRVMYKDMANTGDDFWDVMAGLSVPLAFWSKGKVTGKVQETSLKVRQAEEVYANMRNMVLFEVQQALVKVETNKNLMLLRKNTVIPQAEQTLQSTTAAYQTGETEFLMLIDAYRMLLMARLDYYMAVMDYMASIAALEQAVGLDVRRIAEKL